MGTVGRPSYQTHTHTHTNHVIIRTLTVAKRNIVKPASEADGGRPVLNNAGRVNISFPGMTQHN